MKSLAILLLSALACAAQPFTLNDPAWMAQQQAAATGGGACTVATGNITNETFEGSVTTGWSVVGSGTWGDALPGTSPCSGLGTKSLACGWNGTATNGAYGATTASYNGNQIYHRFYLYIDSVTDANTDLTALWAYSEESSVPSGGNTGVYLTLTNTAGQHQLVIAEGATFSAPVDISVTTWYRIEVSFIANTATTGSSLRVYNAAGSQVGTEKSITTGNYTPRYVHFYPSTIKDATAITYHVDGFGCGNSTWLGQ